MNLEVCFGKQGRREFGRCIGMDKDTTTVDTGDYLQEARGSPLALLLRYDL